MLPRSLVPPLSRAPLHLSATGNGFGRNQEEECEEEDIEEEDDESEECDEDKTKEQKAEERGKEEEEAKKQEQENKEDEAERQASRPASETQSPPAPYISVLSGADPDLGPRLRDAAAGGKSGSPPTVPPFCPSLTLCLHRPLTPQFDFSSHIHPSH